MLTPDRGRPVRSARGRDARGPGSGGVLAALAWPYAALLLAWFALRLGWGDRLWWAALLASFTPFFFLPLALLLPLVMLTRLRRRRWLRRAIFIPAALAVLLYGRLFLPDLGSPGEKAPALSAMTFNIWGGSRAPETAQAIAEAGYPDLVALQELTPEMVDVVVAEVGAAYPYRQLVAAPAPWGLGILSRLPMEPVVAPHLQRLSDCNLQVVRVETSQGPVIVYNAHPHSSNILVYIEDGVSVATATRESQALREACILALAADAAARSEPVIVLGDFNSTDRSDVYRVLTRFLRDAHRDAGWGFGHTFPAYAGSFRGIPIPARQMRIDMVLYSGAFRALTCRVSAAYGESDHHPVVARLIWR